MSAIRSYEDALRGQPKSVTKAFLDNPDRWKIIIDGNEMPQGTDVEISSPYGSFKTAVVMNEDGTPGFDRPIVYEAPGTSLVAWGRAKDGTVRIAVILQQRPHADDPKNQWKDNHVPVVFGQTPMGYLDKLTGGKLETPEAGAVREAGEEAGATAVLRTERPKCPWQNANPTFVGSWMDLVFVEVDLSKVEELKFDKKEPIYSAEYVTVPELLRRIREGKDEKGAYYRMGISNSIWLIFFATHPELWDV